MRSQRSCSVVCRSKPDQTVERLLEGMIGAETTYNENHPNFIHLVTQYKSNTGEAEVPYLNYAATSYDAVVLIKEGLEKGAIDASAFRDWLYTIKGWEGVGGSLTIDSNGDPESGHIAKVVKNGEVVLK